MYKFMLNGVQLPVAPEKFSMKANGKNETMELVSGGEINFIRSPGLTEFSFEFLIPAVKYPFAEYPEGEFKAPNYYLEMLEMLFKSKNPFKFAVYRKMPSGVALFDTCTNVTLENYSYEESAGEGMDLIAKVELKKYLGPQKVTYEVKTDENGEAVLEENVERPDERQLPESYTVQKGDNLWSICKAHFGDGGKFWEVAEKNGIKNPRLIYPGQVIKFE